MFACTRLPLYTTATIAVIGLAATSASAQVRFPQAGGNQIVIPPGPKVNPAGIPQPPRANPIRVMPAVNSFPGFPTYPAANPWNPNPALNNPFANPAFVNPRPLNNPFNNNPFNNNPFNNNPFNNPLVNNNPLINNNPFINNNPLINNNPFLLNPFVNNPFNNPFINNNPFNNPFNNPIAVNPFAVNPFAQPGFINPVVGFAPPTPAHPPGTLVYQGPNTFVNNVTGAVVQPITGTTFADGTTVYRFSGIENPNSPAFPRPAINSPFLPYVW